MSLTDFACKNAAPTDKPYRLTDRGDGLTLEVRPNGSKLWSYCQIWCLSGAGHAAIWLVLASIPSLNLTSVMTLAR
jgi:hypothetical protein